MKIIALVENKSQGKNIKPKHGLSFYIETSKHKILFDLGPDRTLFKNAKEKGIDLSIIDLVIISHGHVDHGGALKDFLKINKKAKIYIQRKAFEKHFTKIAFLKKNIGLDESLLSNDQMVLLDGNHIIDEELSLFIVKEIDRCFSPMNNVLLDSSDKDYSLHEQNLLINDSKKVLIIGCGHCGIINILEELKENDLDLCIGGYHLFNPINKKTVPTSMLEELADYLKNYSKTLFFTCHCTGIKAFNYLSNKCDNIQYFHCGNEIIL